MYIDEDANDGGAYPEEEKQQLKEVVKILNQSGLVKSSMIIEDLIISNPINKEILSVEKLELALIMYSNTHPIVTHETDPETKKPTGLYQVAFPLQDSDELKRLGVNYLVSAPDILRALGIETVNNFTQTNPEMIKDIAQGYVNNTVGWIASNRINNGSAIIGTKEFFDSFQIGKKNVHSTSQQVFKQYVEDFTKSLENEDILDQCARALAPTELEREKKRQLARHYGISKERMELFWKRRLDPMSADCDELSEDQRNLLKLIDSIRQHAVEKGYMEDVRDVSSWVEKTKPRDNQQEPPLR